MAKEKFDRSKPHSMTPILDIEGAAGFAHPADALHHKRLFRIPGHNLMLAYLRECATFSTISTENNRLIKHRAEPDGNGAMDQAPQLPTHPRADSTRWRFARPLFPRSGPDDFSHAIVAGIRDVEISCGIQSKPKQLLG